MYRAINSFFMFFLKRYSLLKHNKIGAVNMCAPHREKSNDNFISQIYFGGARRANGNVPVHGTVKL